MPVLLGTSVHAPHSPPVCFRRYCHLVMVELAGAVQVRVALVPATVAVNPVGLPGGTLGVAEASSDWVLLPEELRARMWKP